MPAGEIAELLLDLGGDAGVVFARALGQFCKWRRVLKVPQNGQQHNPRASSPFALRRPDYWGGIQENRALALSRAPFAEKMSSLASVGQALVGRMDAFKL
jgi:hypothetical protein